MNDRQKKHAILLANEASDRCFDKYEKGATEHSETRLWEFSAEELLDFAIDEAIDQINYLLTLKGKYRDARKEG
jgi:hypothetical protein